jgi:hypothetical protein
MDFNQHKFHPEHRYCNAQTLLKNLHELDYFISDTDSPSKWETGKKELAKLSEEEIDALHDILQTMYIIVHNIKTDTSSQTNKFVDIFIEEIKELKNK